MTAVDVPPEPQTTWDRAERAAEEGDHRELVLLLCRLHGMGQWRVTAQIGSMYELGGQGVDIDVEQALLWYRRAVFESDDPLAHLGLGRLYFAGSAVEPQNLDAARCHLEKAFAKGRPEAGIHLGLMYMHGHGVGKDVAAAERYFIAAGEADFPLAFHYLARSSFLRGDYRRCLGYLVREQRLRFRLRRQDRSHPNLWKP
jgi:TPR repeat protein